jgi:perosamine synthetase
MPPSIRIPVYQPDLSGNERAYVDRCLQSTWISSKGEFIDRFQQGFAGYIGAPHALAVANGTVALHLALAALELGPGDEVIVPSLTYVAAVNAIRYVGATPVFADADPATWQVSVAHVATLINGRTKAILAVHLYGQACDMAALVDLARRHRLRLIEDCAEAFGTKVGAKHVGTFGDIATFSFFGNKTITTGEGGMVVAADPTLHRKALKLRGQGLADDREYWHDVVGFKAPPIPSGCAPCSRTTPPSVIRCARPCAPKASRRARFSIPCTPCRCMRPGKRDWRSRSTWPPGG